MIQITKREAEIMRERGYENFVKKTYPNKPKKTTYYLVEETDDVYRWDSHMKQKELVRLSAMNALKEYRNSVKVK